MKKDSEQFHQSPEARDLAALQSGMLRPALRANQDGGFELGWAMFIFLAGMGPYLNAFLVHSRWFSAWTAWLGFMPLMLGAFAPYAVPKLIKRYITWPRTGYVATPNEPKLAYLVMLMIFGGALGFSLTLPFVLVFEIRRFLSQGMPRVHTGSLILDGLKLLVCVGLVIYLGPKVIRRREPVRGAYDSTLLKEGLSQTPSGRRRLRLVKASILATFIAVPLLAFGIVFGLMYWRKSVANSAGITWLAGTSPAITWSQLGLPSFLLAVNVGLYFMGSGVLLRPHRWKWFIFPAMLLVPALVAPAIPRPVMPTALGWVFDTTMPVMLCLGAVWFLSGAVTMVLFMRRNPVLSGETA